MTKQEMKYCQRCGRESKAGIMIKDEEFCGWCISEIIEKQNTYIEELEALIESQRQIILSLKRTAKELDATDTAFDAIVGKGKK